MLFHGRRGHKVRQAPVVTGGSALLQTLPASSRRTRWSKDRTSNVAVECCLRRSRLFEELCIIEVYPFLRLLRGMLLRANARLCAEYVHCTVWSVLFSFSLPLSILLLLLLSIWSLRPSHHHELLQLLVWLLARLCALLWRCACWIRRQF